MKDAKLWYDDILNKNFQKSLQKYGRHKYLQILQEGPNILNSGK